jgi:RHS repeat-associated protein
VKTVTHKLNSLTAVTLVNNTYDDLGRLKKNSRNGVSSLSDTYEYNVRSWLIGISGAQHTENLTYDYNGNISSMQWRLDGTTRKYAYSYDPLSRLVSATFSGGKDAERYSTSYSYDKHGNILSLQRYGKTANSDLGVYGLADNLTMTYNGNQLTNVSDAAVTVTLPESNDFKKGSAANPGYAYDKNGNLMKDLNKKITAISYNSLYLPELLTIDGVTHKYTYAADGRKLKVVQGSTNRDYVGNIIYENGSLKKILVEGGYIEGGTYYFYFNDHLGNVRAVIDGGNHNIQFNHYYPYGLPMAETSDGKQNEQPYKYNGKEFERKNGLNWMDYGARHYDAALGRFTTMDPLAEKYYGVSPYAYCGNNPVRYVDPDGRKIVDAKGNVIYTKDDGWLPNASQDALRIGNAMMQTRTGMIQFEKMVNADHNITLSISSESKIERANNRNRYRLGTSKKYFVGDKLKSVDIVIFEGTLNEFFTANTSKSKKYKVATKNNNEAIGAIAIHESVHATDEQNIKESKENVTKNTSHDIEKTPNEVENNTLRELFNQHNKF